MSGFEFMWLFFLAIALQPMEDATAIGVQVFTAMPETILELMTMHPQPKRLQPTVEFSPGSRERHPQEAGR